MKIHTFRATKTARFWKTQSRLYTSRAKTYTFLENAIADFHTPPAPSARRALDFDHPPVAPCLQTTHYRSPQETPGRPGAPRISSATSRDCAGSRRTPCYECSYRTGETFLASSPTRIGAAWTTRRGRSRGPEAPGSLCWSDLQERLKSEMEEVVKRGCKGTPNCLFPPPS